MASPHASSFICLPFSDHSDVVTAYTVYFSVCMGSALIGVFGAIIFLVQVIRTASEAYPGKATSQRWILIMLAVSDLCADLGRYMKVQKALSIACGMAPQRPLTNAAWDLVGQTVRFELLHSELRES